RSCTRRAPGCASCCRKRFASRRVKNARRQKLSREHWIRLEWAKHPIDPVRRIQRMLFQGRPPSGALSGAACMQCKDLESVLASEGLGPLSAEAREHLGGCSHCQDFLADLDSIVAVARTLPAKVAPPDRVWISLRAQLAAEGLIKESVAVPERIVWWESLS